MDKVMQSCLTLATIDRLPYDELSVEPQMQNRHAQLRQRRRQPECSMASTKCVVHCAEVDGQGQGRGMQTPEQSYARDSVTTAHSGASTQSSR
jgi:hypothetical protein